MLNYNLIYEDDSAYVFVEENDLSQYQVIVKYKDRINSENKFTTSYPKSLVAKIAKVKKPAWLENEISREESDDYVQPVIKNSILSYLKPENFLNKLILDFGSGSGSSSIILSKLFPDSKIIGVEMIDDFIDIAEERIEYLGIKNVKFIKSESPEYLPKGIKSPDFIVMCGVYEHLLPKEREGIFLDIWKLLKPGGVLFLIETPYSLYPIEFHTTQGLPLINFLPDSIAYHYAKKFSKANLKNNSWQRMLRDGIRGGRPGCIKNQLNSTGEKALTLKPLKNIAKDNLEIWYNIYKIRGRQKLVKIMYYFGKSVKMLTGITMTHYIYLAFQKETKQS